MINEELMRFINGAYVTCLIDFNYKNTNKYKKEVFGKSLIHSIKNKHNKKAILFLAGSCVLNVPTYMLKSIDDLIKYHNIDKTYDLYIFNNDKTINLLCIDEISSFLKTLDYEEVTIVSFSLGCNLLSHALKNISHSQTKYNGICVNPLLNLPRALYITEKEASIIRTDIGIYYVDLYKTLNGNSNFFNIFNRRDFYKFIKERLNIDKKQHDKLTKFTFDMPNTNIHIIHSPADPLLIFTENNKYIEQKKNQQTCNIKHYYQEELTHCTSMFSHPERFANLLNSILTNIEIKP
jgi:hypothetical protein